jgi:hypothetical protein
MLFVAHVFSPNRVIGYNFPPVKLCWMCIRKELTIVSHSTRDYDSISSNRRVDIERIELFFFSSCESEGVKLSGKKKVEEKEERANDRPT